MKIFSYDAEFLLENGETLPSLKIAYQCFGTLNKDASNVVWVCHALTASADVQQWWPGLVGENCSINPQQHFIICANILGSHYGTTGPLSTNPITQEKYYHQFPNITIRDMVNAHILLRKHLGIEKIHLLIGGSMGGYQALEWAVMEKNVVQNLFLIATSAAESAWGKGIHAAQRLAISVDQTWKNDTDDAGLNGLKAARAIGMISYRNYQNFQFKQSDVDINSTENYKAESYIQYQGNKLASRFNAFSYVALTKAMDTHHLARNRNTSLDQILSTTSIPVLVIGISSDILCPVSEQQFIANLIPNATYIEIDSTFGHDGFLVEAIEIGKILKKWLP